MLLSNHKRNTEKEESLPLFHYRLTNTPASGIKKCGNKEEFHTYELNLNHRRSYLYHCGGFFNHLLNNPSSSCTAVANSTCPARQVLVNYLFPSEKSPSLTLSGPRTCQSALPIPILSVTANFYEISQRYT